MTLCEFVFVAIDYCFDLGQNHHKEYRDKEKKIVVEKDIVYDEKFNTKKRNSKNYANYGTLDTYYIPKKDDEKYPVLFYIHGGGFEAGDKHFRRGISRWYALQGFKVVNINYTLSPEFKFPTPIQNVAKAFNWVFENAEEQKFDLDKILVTGDSGGGYMTLMVSAMATNKELQDKVGVKLLGKPTCMVTNCGVFDLKLAFVDKKYPFNLNDKLLQEFMGVRVKDFAGSDMMAISSPIEYVNKDFPPTFVTYSKYDIFCGGQGERLCEELEKHGIYHESFCSKMLYNNHCFSLGNTTCEAKKNDKLTYDFVQRFLKGELPQCSKKDEETK